MNYLQQFNHQISGNPLGHKLVLLHGLMGSLANWRRIIPPFENNYQVLVFDQRGHGRSIQPEHGYTPSDFSHDLAGILDELQWKQINLVGHSMGGRNALAFAREHASRLVKLVIEDIGPESQVEPMNVIRRLVELVPTPFENRTLAKAFFDNKYESLIQFHPQPRVIRQFLYSNLYELQNGQIDWRFSKSGIFEALKIGHSLSQWDIVEDLKVPTLWIRGENSTDLPRSVFDEIPLRNPRIKTIEIKGAGHWVHFDQPDAFITVVKDFLTFGS